MIQNFTSCYGGKFYKNVYQCSKITVKAIEIWAHAFKFDISQEFIINKSTVIYQFWIQINFISIWAVLVRRN